jgi:hypothetical protein
LERRHDLPTSCAALSSGRQSVRTIQCAPITSRTTEVAIVRRTARHATAACSLPRRAAKCGICFSIATYWFQRWRRMVQRFSTCLRVASFGNRKRPSAILQSSLPPALAPEKDCFRVAMERAKGIRTLDPTLAKFVLAVPCAQPSVMTADQKPLLFRFWLVSRPRVKTRGGSLWWWLLRAPATILTCVWPGDMGNGTYLRHG